jgi:hypothetical protein
MPTSTKLLLSKLLVSWHFGQVVASKVLYIYIYIYVAPNDQVDILM